MLNPPRPYGKKLIEYQRKESFCVNIYMQTVGMLYNCAIIKYKIFYSQKET